MTMKCGAIRFEYGANISVVCTLGQDKGFAVWAPVTLDKLPLFMCSLIKPQTGSVVLLSHVEYCMMSMLVHLT